MGADHGVIGEVLAACNGYPDAEVAAAVVWKDHQRSPRLFVRTVPEALARRSAQTSGEANASKQPSRPADRQVERVLAAMVEGSS